MARFTISVLLLASGCRSAHEVALTSYREATRPVNLGEQESDSRRPAVNRRKTPTAEASSDNAAGSGPPAASARKRSESTPPGEKKITEQKPRSLPSPSAPATKLEFPTAKPVEGKPGYVYSPFDTGKYVDVSGYAPGSKVKDPYSGKIFLVP